MTTENSHRVQQTAARHQQVIYMIRRTQSIIKYTSCQDFGAADTCNVQARRWWQVHWMQGGLVARKVSVRLSSGDTSVGVTRGGNSGCTSPLFFTWEKLTIFFSHYRLSITLFCPKKLTTFSAHHYHFYSFPLFFVNSATNFFRSGVIPWRVSPGAVRLPLTPPRLSTAVTPSEKNQLTLMEVHYALPNNEPKMNIVRCI